jgi:hypothetical protein
MYSLDTVVGAYQAVRWQQEHKEFHNHSKLCFTTVMSIPSFTVILAFDVVWRNAAE